MQLKGLVRFFTILLILYSIYELSFTWVVRSHERKMEARAKQFVDRNYPEADSATKAEAFDARYKRLLDSTKDETVHYGFTGAISYDQAKREELNLGLDLKGGINVTMEVELSGLLRTLSNNSKDPNFLKALENANARKANSGADYISLFIDEYKKLAPDARLATLFAASGGDIKITDTDSQVIEKIRKAAYTAFDNTYRVLRTRIDKFGVAQPNINPDRERDIITIELPGFQDPERVRKYLQTSANLQFWEVYKPDELVNAWTQADALYDNYVKGIAADSVVVDTTNNLAKRSLFTDFKIGFEAEYGGIPSVAIKDTGAFSQVLNAPVIRRLFPADARFAYGIPGRDKNNKSLKTLPIYVLRTKGREKAPLEGDVITSAQQAYDQLGSRPTVSLDMTTAGSRDWEKLTTISYNEKRPIAIVLDDIVYSAPVAHNGPITGGRTEISGDFTLQEAQDLASILKAGRLPAPAKIVQEQVVGPTLGEEAIRGGLMAFVISFAVIFLLMLVYYNTSGWVANIALLLNMLYTVGVLTGLGAPLTAPGIAGLVLTIGMAVDTNVLIYERIKEELTRGATYVNAVNQGYRRSLPPVLDGHITTMLTAIILFYFGLGPVKGFATTQILGLLLSLFCGILVSRWVTEWFTNKKKHLEYFTPLSKRIFRHANFKFIEYRKVAYIISFIILALGIGALINGFDQGIEFKGGRSYTVRFNQPVSSQVEEMRRKLNESFNEVPTIKTIGGNSQLDITTSYRIEESGEAVEQDVREKLFAGLNNYLPQGTTFEQFNSRFIVGTTTVLPTISDELQRDAKWATFWSLLVIALYIFIRFRDWRYSLGTVVALFHDVTVILIVFSFFKDIVPFPLELDQHFIAAILTVIGFSMNDTVVVFDRIREYGGKMFGASRGQIINKAINETLSRTIMTSVTVFLTLLILFIFGGDVTRGFAFAMLIGVVTGCYSSIFVAAPILVDLGGKKPLGADAEPTEKNSVKKVKSEA